ncbi:sporulation protein [Shewanella mangrovi]|uniref:Sporulation protein n=1 Tax=Shewanella mangrovi TaxID=1515746 RepID=A0A094JIF3_9GAMM|nr:SPOR domain-containing protein [Shewanella mangrovi]KFZ37804.1 sporulation protein [Shewanella mangrovi]
MRSDYANSKPRKPRQRGKSKASKPAAAPVTPHKVSPLKLVVGLAVVVAFFYALWFLKHDDTEAVSSNGTEQKVVEVKVPTTSSKPKDALPPKPKEEWTYQKELENKQVEVDVPEKANQPTRPYQMQCGSFRKDSQAQELKAVIAFQGLEAQVRKVNGSSGDWYKVILGPYDHKRQAERDRHTLQRAGVNGCMIWFWQS